MTEQTLRDRRFFECLLDALTKLSRAEWFVEYMRCAVNADGHLLHRYVVCLGQHQEWKCCGALVAANAFDQLLATQMGHLAIRDDQVWTARLNGVPRFFTISCPSNVKTNAP